MDDNEQKILRFPPPSPGFIPSTLPFFVVGIGASAGGIEALAGNGLAGKRILVVDDAPETLEALALLLAGEGALVTTASCAARALEIVEQSQEAFHLVVSDIGMPDMDGYALLAALRKLAMTATTPAVAMSGFTRPRDVNQALAAGFETHIRKPVAFDQFIATAARVSR